VTAQWRSGYIYHVQWSVNLTACSVVAGLTKRRRADWPGDGSVGWPVVGGVVRPVVQDLTKRDGPDDGSVRVVKSVWYCKHIGIAFVTSSSHLLFRFSGMGEWTERRLCYWAMAALLVVLWVSFWGISGICPSSRPSCPAWPGCLDMRDLINSAHA